MKIVFLALLLLSISSFAQKQITLEEIPDNINKKVTICDKIYGSYIVKNNGMTLLNIGKSYPDNPLTLAIFEKDLVNFSYVPADFLPEKYFCVTGKLILYKDKPEIILRSEKDIQIQNRVQNSEGL